MMKKTKIIIAVILVFTAVNLLKAQDDFSMGSLYSAYGVGLMRYSASHRTDAMGIQGIGLLGNYINNLNPASNTYLRNTLVTLGVSGLMLKTSNDTKSVTMSDANVTGFNLGVPIWNNYGVVLLFGFNPMSTVQYKITGIVNQAGTTFTETFAGLGGLSRINFGAAGKPLRFISLGAEFNYAFGNVKELSFFNFNSSTTVNTYIRTENDLKGSFFKGGAVLELGYIFPKSVVFDNLNIGFYYQTNYKLSSYVDKISLSMLGFDTTSTRYPDVNMPESYGFGISKKIGRQLILSSDVMFQKFSKFKSESLLPGDYADNYRIGAGFEVLPKPESDKTFWESLYYRGGFSYDNSIMKINNEQVNNYSVSLGVAIPLNNEAAIDFDVTAGTRGRTDIGLVKDNYIKFNLGLNFGEFWFLKSTREDL